MHRRAFTFIDCVDTALIASSLGMGAAGVGLLSTIIAAPVVIALEAAALACGLVGTAGKYASWQLLVKAKKHDGIPIFALSKRNGISDVISNALHDGHISPKEFKLVLNEIEKYGQMKANIQKKSCKVYTAQESEATKNTEQTRERKSKKLKKEEDGKTEKRKKGENKQKT